MGAISDKMKGKGKQIEGRLTGDPVRKAEGAAEEAKGDVERVLERVKDRVSTKMNQARAKRAERRGTRAR
jgi:uncharacterized protein YjbJ (UPF0337 family)